MLMCLFMCMHVVGVFSFSENLKRDILFKYVHCVHGTTTCLSLYLGMYAQPWPSICGLPPPHLFFLIPLKFVLSVYDN